MIRFAKSAKVFSTPLLKSYEYSRAQNLTSYTKIFHKQEACFSKYRKPSSSWEKPHVFRRERKTELIFNAGIWLLVFGLVYSMVPLYKIVCQHMGFDVDYEKKDYSMKGKKRIQIPIPDCLLKC